MREYALREETEVSAKVLKKKEHIINAALIVFSQKGLNGARMEEIAEEAHISKSNIFYYFKSKEVLYVAVLERVLSNWLSPLDRMNINQDPRNALKTYIEEKYKISKKSPAASRLYALEIMQGAPHLMPILKGPLKSLVKEKVAVIDGWIAENKIKPVSAIHLIFHIWAVTQHYSDFSTQTEAVSNHSLRNKKFANDALNTSIQLLVDSLVI
ncbi:MULTISPECIES: TetR family transcriptional regulator C-terminal domain-containing protein [unclassified Psychrobacter]|uniref:TetR family transcriptional regulator C-terminal domain-containing protein n=1 Tax=unclassified Psychrobacter TaxID=196806 RepID=UPI003FB7021C